MEWILNAVSKTVASGFGLGCLPSLLSVGKLALPLRWTGAGFLGTVLGLLLVVAGFPVNSLNGIVLLVFLTVIALWSAHRAERLWQVKDDTRIICDEVVGFLWSVIFLPWGEHNSIERNFSLLAAFILFRLFDVCKWPYPGAQKFKGGWGILLDDLLAGLTVNLILQIFLRLLI